jgi:hypothetical protein
MAQLSTDTLVYTQIISKIQDFLYKYYRNENNESIDFDKEYKKLLLEIEKSVGMPMSKFDFLNKGEIPSSKKFNDITQQMSKDINIMMNQLDSLVANYVNSFNQMSNYIEEEKTFIDRIRSKISALELYSNSSATNITYFSDFFDNLDFVDTTKIRSGYIPEISEGFACLPKKNMTKQTSSIAVVNQNYNNQENQNINFVDISNGLRGSYHLYNRDLTTTPPNQFLHEKDTSLLKSNVLAMIDESPATYFEYEALNVIQNDSIQRPEYEFNYSINDQRTNLINWSNFDTTKPLKLSLEITLRQTKGAYINYISVVPFFGYDGIDLIKNIKVSSLKIYDDSTETPKVSVLFDKSNNSEVYIGSDVYATSLSMKKKYFYKKGVFRFQAVKATKVYITFEQSQFNDVSIKHAYWTPYPTQQLANTSNQSTAWNGQARFNPTNIVLENNQPQNIIWDKSRIIPTVSKPEEKKTIPQIIQLPIRYNNSSTVSVSRIKLETAANTFYYYSTARSIAGNSYIIFRPADQAQDYLASSQDLLNQKKVDLQNILKEEIRDQAVIVIPNSTTEIESYINERKNPIYSVEASGTEATFESVAQHNLSLNDIVYIYSDNMLIKSTYKVSQIVNNKKFKVTISALATPIPVTYLANSFFIKQSVFTANKITIETGNEQSNSLKQLSLYLKKNFEFLTAKRAAIGIRDIFVGMETFADAAEIVSKPFAINGKLELLNLQVEDFEPVEKDGDGQTIGVSKIRYYISVDNGASWIEISPTNRPFSGVPEILSFNQNLTTNATIPQIAYFNSPEVPEEIKSVIFKAVMRKERNVKTTPIIYSYKLGLKVT